MNNKEKIEELDDFTKKILGGLELAYERLIEFKKQKNSELVVMKDGKIVKIKPENISQGQLIRTHYWEEEQQSNPGHYEEETMR